MRLVNFSEAGESRVALVLDHEPRRGEGIVAADVSQTLPGWPRRVVDILPFLDVWRPRVAAALAGAPRISIDPGDVLPPIPEPRHFFAVGLNYVEHAREMGMPPPAKPRLFGKLPGTVHAPFAAVRHPGFSDTLDYEGELALVVARSCRDVPAHAARDCIAGYMIVNDLSLRALVDVDTVMLGKGCDGFAPQGPWLTTADEVSDPHALRIQTWVNDELRQDGGTQALIFDPETLLAWCSRGITLHAGDLISTGSPPGSGHGMRPPRYLRGGDRVRVRIESLGWIENRIAGE